MMLVFCQMTSPDRIDGTLEMAARIRPYVDRIVIIVNETKYEKLGPEDEQSLLNIGCEVYKRLWNDNFPDARNAYLEKCQHDDWVIVTDSDEFLNKKLCQDLRKIIEEAERKGYHMLLVNSHDVLYRQDGTKQETKSDFFKNLIFKKREGVYYEGVGETKNVHETLRVPPGTVQIRLNSKEYWYTHVKHEWQIWERAARNVFIGGGGNNVGKKNKAWIELRKICNELGIYEWHDFRKYMYQGNIDQKLKEWLINNRYEGYDYEHEMLEMFRWYFEYLHPEEKPEGIEPVYQIKDEKKEIYRFIEHAYLKVLGRHADDFGKDYYAKAILEGRIKKEELEDILRRSTEYQEKNQYAIPYSTSEQDIEYRSIKKVPIELKIGITEDMIRTEMFKSNTFHRLLRNLKWWDVWRAHLSVAYKDETQGKGTDDEPVETFEHYVEKIKSAMPIGEFNNILNIGAGCGAETYLLQKQGYNVVGITLGADNVRYAKEKFNIDLLEQEMHFLNFPESFFDGVVLIHTFEHSYAPLVLIGEIYFVLRDYGRVYVAVPDPEAEHSDTIWHVNLLTRKQIIRLFNYWGFRLIDTSNFEGTRQGWDKYEFVFEKLPPGHEDFKNWGYLKHVYERRKLIL